MTQQTKRKRVLFCGDAVAATGFSRATHNYCWALVAAGYDVHVLGINYPGDWYDQRVYPFKVYSCTGSNGDAWGVARIHNLAVELRPDVIVIQQDPWNFPYYHKELRGINIPVVGVVAVDGANCQGTALNWLQLSVFWTQYGESAAASGGHEGSSTVIPLGVDLNVYKQLDRAEVRESMLYPIFDKYGLSRDTYVVGTVGRNQPRKRFDLTLSYFADWVHSYRVKDAVLWVHSAPTGDDCYDIRSLAEYFGVKGRVLVPDPNPIYGVTEEVMAHVYNLFDLYFSTTLGEGWGLPAMEAMACGTPCLLPEWSAYAEWADAAQLVDCTSIFVQPNINTVGGVMDREHAVNALQHLYVNPSERVLMRDSGIALTQSDKYRWANIGKQFVSCIDQVIERWNNPPIETDVMEEAAETADEIDGVIAG